MTEGDNAGLFEAEGKSILRFWMCSLQLRFQRGPPNSKEIKFISEKCPEIVFPPSSFL